MVEICEILRISDQPVFNWAKAWTPPAPRVPDAVIAKTAAKYQEALARLTS